MKREITPATFVAIAAGILIVVGLGLFLALGDHTSSSTKSPYSLKHLPPAPPPN